LFFVLVAFSIYFFSNIVNIFQPEVICIGGGLSGAGDRLLIPLKEKIEPFVHSRNAKINTRIRLAELGNDAGLIGAAVLGKDSL